MGSLTMVLGHVRHAVPGKQTNRLPDCGATAVTEVFCLCSKGCPGALFSLAPQLSNGCLSKLWCF